MKSYLRQLGVDTILGGEFEEGLVACYRRLSADRTNVSQTEPIVSLARQEFILPDRRGLPHLSKYAYLVRVDGQCPRVGGYTEASRGCKHQCRHCPIVPVYGGQFRMVQSEIVLEDIEQQVQFRAQDTSPLAIPISSTGRGTSSRLWRKCINCGRT